MLQTKDLVKIYKPKKGVPVTALNKISLTFPETGMVFLLGKSGSGKSTLLNVLGGLDKYDNGEIIIKGVSSKNFKQQHFDSYRNTYVGFIFQEYNVLDEFSVGANIALAIELQDRKANDEEINNILKEVDLEGFGDRKPNELSGGQKQRVAIARALVKSPEIIMADEPTGALDSNTGRQVFDTLKKLSNTKLVIVVSHDREFAEQYADRIIELSDGNVISDVELAPVEVKDETAEIKALDFHDNIVDVPCGYHLTESDRKAINDYIEKISSGSLEITVSRKNQSSKRFISTDVSKIKTEDGSTFKLIKSKLPLKNAFKIGSSGLKYKKLRLVITIILSCVSFGLFGLADTFGAYNHVKTCTNSIMDSSIDYASVTKAKNVGHGIDTYWRDYGYYISESELKDISKNTGTDMTGVYTPINANLDFASNINPEVKLSETDYNVFTTFLNGYAEINEDILSKFGYKLLAGNLPTGTNDEIAISEYVFEVFKKAGYTDGSVTTAADGTQTPVYQTINSYSDLIGKVLNVNNKKYTITGVVDTKLDISRYISITEKKENQSNAEKLVDYALYNEFSYATGYSLSNVIMVGNGYVQKLAEAAPNISAITEGYLYYWAENINIDPQYLTKLSNVKNQKVIWLDGEKTSLGKNEIVVTSDVFGGYTAAGDQSAEDGTQAAIDYKTLLNGKNDFEMYAYRFDDNTNLGGPNGYKIVGVIELNDSNSSLGGTVVCDDDTFSKFTDSANGIYNFAVGAMPKEKDDVQSLVSYCYREDSKLRYQLKNSVTFELDTINEVLETLSKVFLYIGIGFAAFAALMLANFIGTSISHKKQEIGILRAIGSRSNDVFRIFFAESFIIAMINFILSSIGVFVATIIINYEIRTRLGVLITILNFGPRQLLLLLAVSILVAALASFLPVKKIASKRPIDAIRNR